MLDELRQFKSIAYTKEEDADPDKSSDDEDGAKVAKVQSIGYYVTHALKKKKLSSSDASNANLKTDLLNCTFKRKDKTDVWYTTKTIDGFDTLIVYGAQNLEGVAAFRKRTDKSVGKGYYNSDKDCFITSAD